MAEVNEFPPERITEAVQKAEATFWQIIAEEFPEAQAGDMHPVAAARFEEAARAAVVHWLECNTSYCAGEQSR